MISSSDIASYETFSAPVGVTGSDRIELSSRKFDNCLDLSILLLFFNTEMRSEMLEEVSAILISPI